MTNLPVGFKPPVLVGIAPAKPSAANPASGFLANPDICEKREKRNDFCINKMLS